MGTSGNDRSILGKAFLAGCLGCLGAGVLAIVLVVVLLLVARSTVENRMRSVFPGLGGPLPTIVVPSLPIPLPSAGTPLPLPIPIPTIALPNVTLPSLPALPGVATATSTDCYAALKGWAATSELGDPVVSFTTTDGIYPVVVSTVLCGTVEARLTDAAHTTLNSSTRVILIGRTPFGNLNLLRRFAAGAYNMEFRHGDTILQTIPIVIK
jgi:hypothetical protein